MLYYEQFYRIRSARVERSNKLYQLKFAFVLYFLLLHAKVIIVSVVCVDDHHIQTADNANLGISLHIVIRPLLEFSLLGEDLLLVHYLLEEALVLSDGLDLAALRVFDEFEDVVAVNDDLLLFLP